MVCQLADFWHTAKPAQRRVAVLPASIGKLASKS
jgi:hypothetical protein